MGKWGKCDFEEFKKLQDLVTKADIDKLCRDCAKELAARLLALTIKRTPVHDYSLDKHVHFITKSGKEVSFVANIAKKGGTLRRGWTGGKNQSAVTWAKSLPIHQSGHMYQIEIINPVEYASYVEYGHRTLNHKGWVKGEHMLEISVTHVDAQSVVEQKIKKFLEELINA